MGRSSTADAGLAHWPAEPTSPLPATTLGDELRSAAHRWPERTALVDGARTAAPRRRWSYADLLSTAEEVAHALLRRFEPGERLAIWSANSPEWVCVELGAALAGLTLVTVNPAYRPNELEYVLAQAQVSGIVVAAEHRGRNLVAAVEEVRPRLPASGRSSRRPTRVRSRTRVGRARFPTSAPTTSPRSSTRRAPPVSRRGRC